MTKTVQNGPRALDHVVLPTASLAVARQRLSSLGFTVAPEGVHPFGTINCCIYLADGTFLEPLAVGDASAVDLAVSNSNVFVARDRSFRVAHGNEGFSAVVFASDDADADHREFVEAGVSAGPRLDFSRPFVDAGGRADVASFRLAFTAEPANTGDAFFFACERANAPKVDRSALQVHANGVRRVVAIEAKAANSASAAAFLSTVARSASEPAADGTKVSLANTDFIVRAATGSNHIQLGSIVFAVDDLASLRMLLAERGIEHDLDGHRLVIPPAPGQGAAFIFEEQK
ncbi:MULTISPECIES: VOC family protein [Hyphomicrobiales]|uniref:VOC family protein n=1 Tax=Hyphomicrobiales TaxID=356 RepID=UPI000372033B|nr:MULTISPECIES: VOC family protein [Phyllobacteriaceae]MCX8569406.1 VOC family protein [Aminobacter sp. MET-1]